MVTRYDWMVVFLRRVDSQFTDEQKIAALAWSGAENTQAKWNPFATTWDKPGSTDFNSVGVKNYVDWTQGLQATMDTLGLSGHGYGLIRVAFKSPELTADDIVRAIGASDWGTSGTLMRQLVPQVQSGLHAAGDVPLGQ